MKRKYWVSAGLFGAVSVVLLSVLFINSALFSAVKIGADRAPVVPSESVRALNKAYESVSSAVLPAVVSIGVKIEKKKSDNQYHEDFKEFFKFFGDPQDFGPQEGSGSGVLITSDGYILTNNHVVGDATEIKVITNDKKEYKAKLIGADANTDLAVIKIDETDLPYVHFANMDDVRVGQIVFAVGSPLGLNATVTNGIVSFIGRGGLALGDNKSGYQIENFIQTDAPINPGNSGGGLFNIEGSLVGINSAIATKTGTYIGYGFAIPVDLAKAVAEDLIENGKIKRGYLGIRIKSIDDDIMAKSYGLSKVEGVVVHDVVKGSPSEKAGLEVGDVVLELDGKVLKTSNELQTMVAKKKPGDNVDLVVWRDGKKINKKVRLEELNQESENVGSASSNNDDTETAKPINFDKLGFSIEPLTKEIKEAYNVESGAFISKVERNSKAGERGMTPQGVIVKADRQKINSPSDLKKIINAKKSGETILMQIKYKDSNRMVSIEIPD